MNCQQKSGVFLNSICLNTKKNSCSNCKKEVCETHTRVLDSKQYCEDCYWELYLFAVEEKKYHENTNDTTIFVDTTNTMTNSPSTNDTSGGFADGFGGGGFGGGGASSEWTEGDIQSLNDNSTQQEGLLLDADDTFFYS